MLPPPNKNPNKLPASQEVNKKGSHVLPFILISLATSLFNYDLLSVDDIDTLW